MIQDDQVRPPGGEPVWRRFRLGVGKPRRTGGQVQQRLHRQHQRISALERELARVSPQLAALEERVEVLAARCALPAGAPAGAAAPAEVAELLEVVRAEHARVRARISAAARYEERLRVLEEEVDRLRG